MKLKRHYGWVICAGCVLLNFCALGMVTSTMSVYYPFLREDLAMSNTQVSMIGTVRCLSSTAMFTIAGAYYRKLSLRYGSALSCVFVAAGCLLYANARSALMCYLAAAVMGIAYTFGALYPIAVFMHNWFEDRRMTATSICYCGSSLCAIVLPPVVTFFVQTYGLRTTFMMQAILVLIAAAALALLLRDRPSDMGLKPYTEEEGADSGAAVQAHTPNVRMGKWETVLLFGAITLLGVVGPNNSAAYSIHYRTMGYTAMQAASAVSVYGIILACGKFLFGAGADRVGTYRVSYLFQGIWVLACLVTASVDGVSMALLYAAAILNGVGNTIGSMGVTSWTGELTPPDQYETSVRRGQFLFALGSLLGAPLPGMIADYTGTYSGAYLMHAGMMLAAFIVIQGLYIRHRRNPSENLR